MVPLSKVFLLSRNTLLGLWLANNLRAVCQEDGHLVKKLLFFFIRELSCGFKTSRMVILGSPEIDDSCSNLHTVKHT
jgi:hypothetical protein